MTVDHLSLQTLAAIDRFNEAVNRQDLEEVAEMLTEDCVFEGPEPSPDGTRFVGRADVADFFGAMFDSAKSRVFESEDVFAAGHRATVRWIHRWVNHDGTAGSVRGVDVFTVRDGLIAEKLSYVKG